MARLRRSRAARRALDAIRRAARSPDPAATIFSAVMGYLRARFPLAPSVATPAEVATALVEYGVPEDECNKVIDHLRACDAARFAPASGDDPTLAITAIELVTLLEVR